MAEHPIEMGIPAAGDRTYYDYDIPPSLQGTGVKKVSMVELTADEELMATKRIGTEITRLAFELTKESLRFVNGKPVATHDGTADTAWNRMPPKLRGILINEYSRIHNASQDEAMVFNQSRKVRVG